MFKPNKKLILFIFSVIASLSMFFGLFEITFAQTAAGTPSGGCAKLASYFGYTKIDGTKGNVADGLPQFCSAPQILTWAIDKLLVFSGAIAVLFIIVGGFFYLTAAGSDEQIEKGKKILINSVIGLVVIVMATAIVRIVAGTLNGGTVTTTTTTTNTTTNTTGTGGN